MQSISHERWNTFKGVIRSRELALATAEEMKATLGKQGVTNIRRISIRKGKEEIKTNTYILTFNQLHTLKELKIGYCLMRVEMYVSGLLRCFKCQKYGQHREACRRQSTSAKCGEKDPFHRKEDCLKEIRCPNCQQNYLPYSRFCDIYEKKEILEVKCEKNVSFLEARKIVGSYMGENMPLLQRAHIINQSRKQI